jgi:phytol kinase
LTKNTGKRKRLLTPFRNLGSVIGGVARFSLGEVYFPLAVAVLFLLSLAETDAAPGHRLMLYCIPILLLTLADAAAALIGISYGRLRYHTVDGAKSAEGSVAFFICAFFVVHVPLLLCTDTGRTETLLIAVLLAWLATMFEAIAWRGLDNLVLPLISFLLLKIYFGLTAPDLLIRLCVTAILMIFLVLYHRQTTLLGSAVLGAFLAGYVSWALGGWHWLLAPLVLFVSYTLLSPRTEANSRQIHTVHAVLSVYAAGLMWLFLFRLLDRDEFLFPYTLAFAAHLAIIGIARLKYDYPHLPDAGKSEIRNPKSETPWGLVSDFGFRISDFSALPHRRGSDVTLLGICITKGWLLLFVPYLLAEGITAQTVKCTLLAFVGVTVAALAFYWTQPQLEDCPTDTPRWLRQAFDAALGSAFGLVPLYLM